MNTPDRHRILTRELRRGLFIWAQAMFAWARAEPDTRRATLAREMAKVLIRVTAAMSAFNGDGELVPGDAQKLPTTGNVPPHDFTT